MDKVSYDRCQKLHPLLRKDAMEVLQWAWQRGIRVRYTQTLRTFEEQDGLYAQGRTKPGQIVTKAKGGQSMHNYGLALDIALISEDGKALIWDLKYDGKDEGVKSDWMEVIEQFKLRGWDWGGDWKFVDYPHVERNFGHGWKYFYELRALKKVDNEGYVLIED